METVFISQNLTSKVDPRAVTCVRANPLTAGPDYIRFFIFLFAHKVPPFKHVKDKS